MFSGSWATVAASVFPKKLSRGKETVLDRVMFC
jgi:hypothetical protein